MTALFCALAWACLAGLALCVAASAFHFRRAGASAEPPPPMSLIRPMRGLDERFEANAESLVASDPEGLLDIIFAVESKEDEAYASAQAFAARHPGRAIRVLVTGPSASRMGKMHNMIEALPHARHPYVIFSDADVGATPGLLRETGRAFREGCDAAFALPTHAPGPGSGNWAFQYAFNHGFNLPAALDQALFNPHFCAGAWMAYTKEILDKSGGLSRHERAMADDFALSMAARRAGGRLRLLRETARLIETGQGLRQALKRIAKWAVIIRSTIPWAYIALPLVSPGFVAVALLLLSNGSGAPAALAAALFCGRMAAGLAQDALVTRAFMSWWEYLLLPLGDVASVGMWLAGFRSEIEWRGARYRVLHGGQGLRL